jgi:hypothetical protein
VPIARSRAASANALLAGCWNTMGNEAVMGLGAVRRVTPTTSVAGVSIGWRAYRAGAWRDCNSGCGGWISPRVEMFLLAASDYESGGRRFESFRARQSIQCFSKITAVLSMRWSPPGRHGDCSLRRFCVGCMADNSDNSANRSAAAGSWHVVKDPAISRCLVSRYGRPLQKVLERLSPSGRARPAAAVWSRCCRRWSCSASRVSRLEQPLIIPC